MKIQRATFTGVLGVPDMTLDLSDTRSAAPHSMVVLSGPSGSGKTRMIEALIAAKEAIRPYGTAIPGSWIKSGNAAKIQIAVHLDEGERELAGTSSPVLEAEVIFRPEKSDVESGDGLRSVFGRYSHNPLYGKVDYVPVDRRIPGFPPFPGLGAGEQRLFRLAKDARKYGFVFPFLRSLEHDGPRRERFAMSLARLSPSCRYVADTSGEAIPRCFVSRGADPVTATQLSNGESDAVMLAATAAMIGLDHSLVFIDRPDLHVDELEPFIEGLASLGQDNQIFLTGGARLASAARGAHVVSLKGS